MSRPASPRDAHLRDLSPRRIVAELDRHVVGQGKAKRAVAVALRDRWRRQQLPPEVAREITPKNILMVGPTGVGKTEIARRMARLVDAPFVKVEASKFTEVGYVGRDVESIARDLVEAAIRLVKDERRERVRDRAQAAAEEKLVDLLATQVDPAGFVAGAGCEGAAPPRAARGKARGARGGGRGRRREDAPDLRHDAAGGRGDGDRPPRDAPEPLRRPEEEEGAPPGLRGAGDPRRPRGRPPLRRGVGPAGGDPAGGGDGDRLPRRDRQDRGARGKDGRPRRLARGGPARPPPARRGDDRQDEAREREDRPRPLRGGRGVPRRPPVGPHPRAAGALPDPRRARRAHRGRLPPDPHRAGVLPPEAGAGAPLDGGDRARLRRGRPRRHREGGGRDEPEPGEHRRAPPPHDPRDGSCRRSASPAPTPPARGSSSTTRP